MAKRVLIAGIVHETNTFLGGLTPLSEFRILKKDEIFQATGDSSPMDGCLQVAREAGWQVVPAIDMRAMPGPTVDDQITEVFWHELLPVATSDAGRNVDGIFLVLHGAMVTQSCDDVEGEALERIYNLYGGAKPIVGVLDLHCNFTPRMAKFSSALVSYRENPHADARDASVRAARILDRLMNGQEQARNVLETPGIMWPPTGTGTAFEPMKSLEAMAREIENSDPQILAVNVFGGFPFADVPDAGVSLTAATVGDPEEARKKLQVLVAHARAIREVGNIVDAAVDTVTNEISKLGEGPFVIAEPSDNVGAGAAGNGTGLLRALIEASVSGAVVTLNEPEVVQQLHTLKEGDRATVVVGKGDLRFYPPPMTLEVELESTSDGRFELEDRCSHLASLFGIHIDMGPSAVVRHQGIRILLTTNKTPPFDLNQLRSQGIEPTKAFVIGVKAAAAHRNAYDPIAKRSFTVDTPGPCSSNLKSMVFAKVRRPIYPLDV